MPSCQLPRCWVRNASPQGSAQEAATSPASQLWFLPRRHRCCFLYLLYNDIIYLAGSFGWFLFDMLQRFSIRLSPPPSADANYGVHDSSDTRAPSTLYSEPMRRDAEPGSRPEALLPHCVETRDDRGGEGLSLLSDERRHPSSEVNSPTPAQEPLSS